MPPQEGSEHSNFNAEEAAARLKSASPESISDEMREYSDAQLHSMLDILERQTQNLQTWNVEEELKDVTGQVRDELAVRAEELKNPEKKEKRAMDLCKSINSKLERYIPAEYDSNFTHVLFINTPAGKRIAIAVEGAIPTAVIFTDENGEAPRGHALLFTPYEFYDKNIDYFSSSKKAYGDQKYKGSYGYQRAHAYNNLIDFHFEGKGFSHHSQNLSKLFEAFGLQEEMPGIDKLLVIAETLNSQL